MDEQADDTLGQALITALADASFPNTMAAQAHGRASYQLLHDRSACLHAVEVGRTWITAGAFCTHGPHHGKAEHALAHAERSFCARRIYFGVSRAFAAQRGLRFMPLGHEPLWEPALWQRVGRRQRSIRSQLKRAERLGVRVAEAPLGPTGPSAALAGPMALLIAGWRARQAMPSMGFVVALQMPCGVRGERLFVARLGEHMVGFAAVQPVGTRGLLIEHVVRAPNAPNGTTEALVDAVMQAAQTADFVSLGFVPLAGALPLWLRAIRRLGEPFYSFRGLDAYRTKLKPHAYAPLGLAYSHGRTGALGPLIALGRAFAGGSYLLFVIRLVARGPQPVLAMLAFMLPVWTVGLAALPTLTWFPSAWVQQAWVGFDAALCIALSVMLRRPTARRYRWLGRIIALDAVLTTIEAVLYPGPKDLVGLAMHGLGVMAPTLGAIVLLGAARRRSILELR